MQQGSTNGAVVSPYPLHARNAGRVATGIFLSLLTILALLAAPSARAQSVREESTFGMASSYRAMKKAAEEQNVTVFPDVREGAAGTIARLTFDRSNADVSFFTNSTSQEHLLKTAQGIAQDMNLPLSDFITADSKRYRYVDIEMNDYLKRASRSETRFDLDLSRLRTALEKTDLPRPIVFVIRPDGSEAILTADGVPHRLTEMTFLRLEDVKSNTQLRWRGTITWQMYVGAGFFALLFLQLAWLPWATARAKRKQREKIALAQIAGKTDENVPDPAKVQERYDKQKPQWVMMLFMLPMMVLPLVLFSGRNGIEPFMSGLQLLVPSGSPLLMLPLVFAPVLVSSLACFIWEKRREGLDKASGTTLPADPNDEHKTPGFYNILPTLPLLLIFLVVPLFQYPALYKAFLSGLSTLPSAVRVGVILAILFVPSFGGMTLLSWWVHKKTRQTLKPGDFWYDEVQRLAEQAGVKVRHVVVTRSLIINAYASIWGTVGLTSKLLAAMEPDEIRAIIAHEIGHHKARHPWRNFAISIAALAVMATGWGLLRGYLEKQFSSSTSLRSTLFVAGPMLFSIIFPLLKNVVTGKGSRQREYEADRFAVQTTGNPELVIRALRKLHTLNAQPHILKPSDEALMSHPSLAHRIEAIRRDAEASGAMSN